VNGIAAKIAKISLADPPDDIGGAKPAGGENVQDVTATLNRPTQPEPGVEEQRKRRGSMLRKTIETVAAPLRSAIGHLTHPNNNWGASDSAGEEEKVPTQPTVDPPQPPKGAKKGQSPAKV
jgi:hypothetical protein